jgi:AcrR family transcriptional regulator
MASVFSEAPSAVGDAAVGEASCLRARPGRPRSPEADKAILSAALDALVEEGYAGMTMEGIAARARVGKATVYRRWPNKAELVVEALRAHVCQQNPVIDTGDVRADLTSLLQGTQVSLAGSDGLLMAAFTAENIRHPELRAEFDRVFVAERRARIHSLIAAAVARADLPPDTDTELLCDVGFAILWHRLTLRPGAPSADLPARIVSQFVPSIERR